jgi:hypothetical protein
MKNPKLRVAARTTKKPNTTFSRFTATPSLGGLASYGEAAAEDLSSAPGFVLSRPGSSLTPSFGALANWRTKALVRISQLRVVAGKRVAMHPRAVALAAWQEPGS